MTPEEEKAERQLALEKEIIELKAEINTVHTILDGTYVNLPENFEDLKPPEAERACKCAARVQQFIVGLIGCPHRIRHVL
jgi:hypothetical protein